MKRAGGYSFFWVAYKRHLLASSRSLAAADANRLAVGRHRVVVDEYEWGWSFVKLTLEGRARRRITCRFNLKSPLAAQLGRAAGLDLVPGKLGRIARELVGAELWITVAARGDVDILVCQDGTYAMSAGDGEVVQFDSLQEAEEWARAFDLKPRRPAVTGIGPV